MNINEPRCLHTVRLMSAHSESCDDDRRENSPASGPSASEPQTQQKRQMDAEGSGKKGWLVPGIPRAARRSPSWDRAQLAV